MSRTSVVDSVRDYLGSARDDSQHSAAPRRRSAASKGPQRSVYGKKNPIFTVIDSVTESSYRKRVCESRFSLVLSARCP